MTRWLELLAWCALGALMADVARLAQLLFPCGLGPCG